MPGARGTPLTREERVQRRNMAIDLRRAGVPIDTIASRLNYPTPTHAQRDIDLLVSSVLKTPQDEMRGLEALRLDYLTLVLWPEAKKGNSRAIDQVVKIMERRAKLFGLDAPVQVEQITLDGIENEIKKLEQEMGKKTRRRVRKSAEERFGDVEEDGS